jgi:hypothetical protein
VQLHNSVPVLNDGTSRLERFSGVNVGSRMKENHTFGCPVFALQNDLAAGNAIPKWAPRARLGLNLGPSPHHARNINLVLNLSTGLVSPQYHCRYDDFFETCKGLDPKASTSWKQLAGLQNPSSRLDRFFDLDNLSQPVGTNQSDSVFPQHVTNDLSSFPDDQEGFTNDVTDDIINDAPTQEDVEVSEGASVPTDTNWQYGHTGVSRSGRVRRATRKLHETRQNQDFHKKDTSYFESSHSYMQAFHATMSCEEAEMVYAREHDFHLDLQERMRHPIAFHAEMMGDIMYYHQALQQPDADEFVKAIVSEVNGHIKSKHWRLVKRSEVPKDVVVIPSVWAMRRKRNLTTNEITKHKARLNIHGGKQVYGINYYDTYAPVITWFAIRLLMAFAIMFELAMRQVDFIQAYPQAPIEFDMYMELPQGIETKTGNSKDHVLQLLSNLYGQKQAGRVWNQYLVDKLRNIGFEPSLIDECVFYKDDIIFIVYVDDGIFFGGDDMRITQVIKDLKDQDLEVEDQGLPQDYVGVNIKKCPNGHIEFTQRALIDNIIDDAGLQDAYTKPVPAKTSQVLHAYKDSPKFEDCDFNFQYRSIVGKINYLAQTTRPDILFATHQIAKYSSDPRREHGEAIIYLVRYLKKTRHIGLKFKPDPARGFECYCDADFSGNWNKELAPYDPSTAKSRSGWVIFYCGCPVLAGSKLQGMVALSTTEAEYIALSTSLRDVIPIMALLSEMRERGYHVIHTQPHVYCKVFEDNTGALELARLPKLRPRTKHINCVYHHFREHVRQGLIKVYPISSEEQISDIQTKALPQNSFCKHRKAICGE